MTTEPEARGGFTPGPWSVLHSKPGSANPNCQCAQVWADSADWAVAFCDTTQDGEGFDPATMMANARLIAAAPDLVAALQAMLNSMNRQAVGAGDGGTYVVSVPSNEAQQMARAALAKALGDHNDQR